MNTRHRKTLLAVYAEPVPASLPFSEFEALFRALGSEIEEGHGSRMSVLLKGERAHFHRPHPGKEARRYQLRAVREFVERLEITP